MEKNREPTVGSQATSCAYGSAWSSHSVTIEAALAVEACIMSDQAYGDAQKALIMLFL